MCCQEQCSRHGAGVAWWVHSETVKASTSARAVARRELTQAITAEARSQIAQHGADGLSLRAVARALGLASSALYRYFPSRDDLLTTLIVEAYTALGDAVEAADAARDRDDIAGRFVDQRGEQVVTTGEVSI